MQFTNSKYIFVLFISSLFILSSCGDDDMAPPEENGEEIITDVVLTFTASSGSPIVATAQDPDGDGPQDLAIVSDIELAPNTTYALTIELTNSIEQESITDEIMTEADEHMFFFAWTKDIFTDPTGDGNADAREDDAVNYNDQDGGNLPLGLSTTWTTGDASNGLADFRGCSQASATC